jgi:DNA-binding MarR family transcriptional regulator
MSEDHPFTRDLIHWMELSTARSMRYMGHYAREAGLSMPQFSLLMHLHHHGSCGVTDFSRHSGVSNAAASQLIGRLVDKQLVDRVEDPQDRRSKLLTLTPKGQRLVNNSINERYRWMKTLASRLSQTELRVVSNALPILLRCLKELDTEENKSTAQSVDPYGHPQN